MLERSSRRATRPFVYAYREEAMITDLGPTATELPVARFGRHLDLLQRLEEILHEERAELACACAALADGHGPSAGSDGLEAQRLQQENDQLRKLVSDLEEQIVGGKER